MTTADVLAAARLELMPPFRAWRRCVGAPHHSVDKCTACCYAMPQGQRVGTVSEEVQEAEVTGANTGPDSSGTMRH